MNTKCRSILAKALVGIGLLQALGYATGQAWLRHAGALTVASPLPLVFTEVRGVETFALNFELYYESDDVITNVPINSELYSKFKAPYNFRNVIGAAVSYGPVMPPKVTEAVLHYTFQQLGDLSKTLGLTLPLKNAYILVSEQGHQRDRTWRLRIPAVDDSN